MKFSPILAALVGISSLFANAPARAEDDLSGFRGGVQTAFYDSYYFRGFAIFDGAFNMQPSLDLGYAFSDIAVLNFNTWAAVPFGNRDQLAEVRDEVDLTIDATFTPVSGLAISTGAVVYILPVDPVFHTEEVYLGLSYTFDFGLGFKVATYADVNEFKGVYTRGAVTYGLGFATHFTFSAEAFASGTKYQDAESAFTELGAQVGIAAEVGSGVTTTFGVLYNYNDSTDEHLYAISSTARYTF
jgi:hypothetical protein